MIRRVKLILPSSENTSDASLSKEIGQKQREEQAASSDCQIYIF